MFERLHHRGIASILQALDASFLAGNGALFGGGTAIALQHGEYRESVDIDFMVSSVEGYRALRQRLTGVAGMQSVLASTSGIQVIREVRTDQYGIRTMLDVEGAKIKFEIVREARIAFEEPGPEDQVCGVACLTRLDMAASKLLANSDGWGDDNVFSRDLIDLAMMRPERALLEQAIVKARVAYGASIETDLAKAIDKLLTREGRLDRCMQAMHMTVDRAVLKKCIKALTT